ISGPEVGKVPQRVTEDALMTRLHDPRFTRFPALNVHAENELRFERVIDLQPRFLGRIGREHQQQTAIQGCAAFSRLKAYRELRGCGLGARTLRRRADHSWQERKK